MSSKMAINRDTMTFTQPVAFEADVTFNGEGGEPSFSLDNITNLTVTGALGSATLATSGTATIGGALGVTGATTLAAAACTTLAASGAVTCATTLGVTGTSTLAAVNASGLVAAAAAVTVGTTLGVTGATTLAAAACTTLAASGAVTCATTLAVTGTSTMAAVNASGTVAAAGAVTIGTTLAVTGATTVAAVTASGTVTTNGALDCNGPVDLAGATLTMPTGQFSVKKYTSQSIVHGALTAGATCTVALTGEILAYTPLAVVVETTVETTSGNVETTGLSVTIGTAGLPDGYLSSVDIFGAAGLKEGSPGALVGGYRAADDLLATFTAAGGTEDCADITALALSVYIYYVK